MPPTRIYIAGDSTAAAYDRAQAPQTGWGQALGAFTREGFEVIDLARPGRSTMSFIDEGALDAIARDIAPGDHLLISFGHNDQKLEDPNRGTYPRTTYQRYLTTYVEAARARRAKPVLVTSVERRRFRDGKAYESLGDYPEAMLALAEVVDVPVVDLHALSLAMWDELGEERTKEHFLWVEPGHPNYPEGLRDDTHFQARGAVEVARIVAKAAAAQGIAGDAWTDLDRAVSEDEIDWPETLPELL
ncbi:rhamnogalacturonan acetylesterase [Glycomyces sp. L485]|uniref:rhamnogalacturonan acetylesterase n=1 Tax=Glycomyces sp. L485 TaxID=2909235 RepID=UPI001F4A5383|nr:rhamnogalacturonan acetylesterase [Glycomyces sp. L485]MCH7232995.1 rhamnogalacturonan acetylesterase [Glycomyces sp. L485]